MRPNDGCILSAIHDQGGRPLVKSERVGRTCVEKKDGLIRVATQGRTRKGLGSFKLCLRGVMKTHSTTPSFLSLLSTGEA